MSQNNSQSHSQSSLYLNAIKSQQFPTKDQAIVIDASPEAQIQDYVTSLASYVKPEQIKFVSRISNNRVCVYFSNQQVAQEFVSKQQKIKVNNSVLHVRPLITKNIRVVLSNVCPIIPHDIIEQEFAKLEIKLTSQITFLKVGLQNPAFNHIMSFRRQVYISSQDKEKLPESIKITFDETTYYIYLSTDTLSCIICKKEGHLAKNCQTQDKTTKPDKYQNKSQSEETLELWADSPLKPTSSQSTITLTEELSRPSDS